MEFEDVQSDHPNDMWRLLISCEKRDGEGFHPLKYLKRDVSENSGTPKSSIFIRLSIINHPVWGSPIFRNTHISLGALGRQSPLAL